jgi:DUF4097 and DUF4098 domain-containing protein YvlB
LKHIALCLLSLSCVLVYPARADEWSQNFSITASPHLQVETSDANIQVDTWENKNIEARVTTSGWKIGDDGIKIYQHQNGDSIEIAVHFPHQASFGFHHMGRVYIAIHMPREGAVDLHTGDGSILLRDFKGTIDARTGDGRLEIQSADGSLRARSGDGRIEVSGRFDALELYTGDGGIEAQVRPGSKVASSWELKSGDGAINLDLPPDIAADLNLHTGDGHIHTDMPLTVEGGVSRSDIHGKLNGGGNSITIHTGDGSIRLGRL